MNELYEKSIIKLELDKVLALLAENAGSAAAKEQCLRTVPLTDADDIREKQAETTAACKMMTLQGAPGLSGAYDVNASIDRAHRGGTLSPEELLRVAALLKTTRQAREYYGESTDPELGLYFQRLVPNKYLEERIFASILSKDEIADAASSELAAIRRKIRQKSSSIRENLQKIITSPTYAKILQEPIVTIRSDRFVVPVKAECKGQLPGLVHDVSSSGSTYFVEPMSAVNANNELRELFLAEKQEIERILSELSAEAAGHRESIAENYEVLVSLDCIFARAKLSFAMKAIEPQIRTDGRLELIRARHPLITGKTVVPISVRLGSDFDTLIITGPNTGGKTVTLKTIGLLTLMAECGLHIPADDGSFVSVFELVLADIGDEQSIEQSLSTFSSHMKNIVDILQVCDRDSLILFDELCAGTDPAEGAALAIALIEFCRKCGAKIAATTHYAELKLYAMRTQGVINASCEFNVETLQPTYRLLIGIPGKSNAFAISKRLGLDDIIIEDARSMVSQNDVNFEDVLSQLESQRQQMEQAKLEAERLRQETEKQKEKSDEYYAQIKREREKAVEQARKEAQVIIEDARRTANNVYEELKQLRKQAQGGQYVAGSNEKQSQLRRSLNEAEGKLREKTEQKQRPAATRAIRVGDTVELIKLGTKASVLSIGADGSYQLQAGIMKINAKPDEVYLLENETQTKAKKIIEGKVRSLKAAVHPELDIRGMATDEAIPVLDNFLDAAYMGNLPQVRIIHGKGTGVLRAAVHEELRRCKYVKQFRVGVYGEGENGVTIAEFK
ncbi:MAG: endonuclease MutS2 [Clostridia bacterium]|nr:endonuclease MutS2 [Clostridia bacterium]